MFDLADYLCPVPGRSFLLSSNETMQSVAVPDGWIEFRKNKHCEEFYVTDSVIGRGADTSLISNDGVNPTGSFYVQYQGNVYGCPWIARYMDVGEAYHRDCHVIYYDHDGTILADYQEASYINFVAHYPDLTFPSAITLSDVVLLQWGGEEGYLYAYGFGLVGWRNMRDGSFGNYIVALDVPPPPPPFPHEAVPRPPRPPG